MTEVNAIKYKIHLEPDLKNFKFAGSTEILLDAVRPVSETIMNILVPYYCYVSMKKIE